MESTNDELSFVGRKMKLDTAEDAKEIVEGIKNFKNMKALRLEGNTLGLDAAKVIAEALKEKSEFERALWSDMYTGRLRSEIPPSLEHLGNGIITAKANLTQLDLSDNAFGPDGVKGIRTLLTSASCYSLHTLKLNNNGLGIGGGKILSEAFMECHKSSLAAGKHFALKVFISGRNRLEDPGAKALSEAFKVLGSLEHIEMPQNGIRPDGVGHLASAFQKNINLKVVNINDNTCTERGAKAIADCLPYLRNLEVLNVGDCLLKDKGASVLAPALAADMPTLKEVIMSFNEIRRDGALAVAGSMKNKSNLKTINLDGNQLGDSVDEVQDLMSSFDRLDALAPFDDNEEPDSDDEDEDEGDTSVSKETEQADDLTLCIEGLGLSKESPLLNDSTTQAEQKIPILEDIRSFLSNPTSDVWNSFSRDHRKSLLTTVVKEEVLPSVDKVASTFSKTCSALHTDQTALEDISECILGTALADERCSSIQLVSSLLISFGLIKGETKVERIENLDGALKGLSTVILKEYFPRDVTSHFIAFLMKPSNLLDKCSTERHTLLQKLYQK